jgi:hypothetical protein
MLDPGLRRVALSGACTVPTEPIAACQRPGSRQPSTFRLWSFQRLANGYWIIRAPTGDPVGPRIDVAAVIRQQTNRESLVSIADFPPSALAARGMDTRRLQHFLGHASITNTVRYTAMSPEPFKDI